ncbi:hypothetical protein ABZ816_22060 [Actinosynnema sp. NPDC047251]|uniref:hypothetical protein n=1 Tax=Saccharothrix espanaensis TaxID=103731 RepID=UPI0011DE0B4B|nr:hypothetical protein [Saccharothrix espanaensis]
MPVGCSRGSCCSSRAGGYRLLAALPPELRSRAGRIRERVHLDASGWFRQAKEMPFLVGIADAVWGRRRLRVRYRGRAEAARVLLSPTATRPGPDDVPASPRTPSGRTPRPPAAGAGQTISRPPSTTSVAPVT